MYMRTYILTDKEKQAIQEYLKNKIPNDFIHLIKHRAKKYLARLREDLKLLETITES